ncbi:glycosyl transferase family protein [Marinomonas sp. TW1]|uniref:glycosyl transferase family protein n=1 Tax=Marinomonas sp. TW1 TaxID=1561203 RepID=UPI0007AF47E3|nr:glycosyl transferase family protein [Marinomonas sp. TW1]KZN14840.1 glycosyl transferase family 3 [Marinomonas sp. TW1]
MSDAFKPFIQVLGRGKKGARSLTSEEAEQAMTLMLNDQVAAEQSGAFWMLIRIREETVEETVGFTRATRRFLRENNALVKTVDLDWPAYAGKRNELPWFLLSALALANAGVRIVMHGHAFDGEERIYVNQVLSVLGLNVCSSVEEVNQCLNEQAFAYIDLINIHPMLGRMMNLKYQLGLRSPVNTVVRMMNPFFAPHSLHGVFHRGYDALHLAACEQLQDPSVLVFRGGNGEAEVNPEREVTLGKWQSNQATWTVWPKAEQRYKRLKDNLDVSRLVDHWGGETIDPFGEQAVRQTLAAVVGLLYKLDSHQACLALADEIWSNRSLPWLRKAN